MSEAPLGRYSPSFRECRKPLVLLQPYYLDYLEPIRAGTPVYYTVSD